MEKEIEFHLKINDGKPDPQPAGANQATNTNSAPNNPAAETPNHDSAQESPPEQKKPKKPFHFKDFIRKIPKFFSDAYHSLRESIKKAPPGLRKGAFWILVCLGVLVTVMLLVKFISHATEVRHLKEEQKAGPHVRVVAVTRTAGEHTVSVTG
jgi:hypothetical protein